jgi:hypothetical protein
MKKFSRLISWILLVFLGLVITPKELIHEFYGHEDAHCQQGNPKSVEPYHHHCVILQIEAQVFTNPEPYKPASNPGINAAFIGQTAVVPACAVILFANPRAPPVI